jgi:hypothetical protein
VVIAMDYAWTTRQLEAVVGMIGAELGRSEKRQGEQIDALRELIAAQGKHIQAQDKKISALTRVVTKKDAPNVVDITRKRA